MWYVEASEHHPDSNAMTDTTQTFCGQCHCGNIQFEADHEPATLTECNCSLCHRYGVRWAYFKHRKVRITVRDRPTETYCWGDRMIRFHHCPTCGCVTHYTGVTDTPDPDERVALNARLADRHLTETIRIRHFDGADTWTFLD
ncbi:hypothetical protein MED297_05214 [Reinekea sp. MED297]|uniref:CENP-V/GFA domain-containing protein n=2 Tax=Reinekea TaxID=230494 RepID=A4BJ64_9GAMM|nr:hypothetical protein MED297_05214 [Reinekea sp. MED297] [Reinekea blandensis MED297]